MQSRQRRVALVVSLAKEVGEPDRRRFAPVEPRAGQRESPRVTLAEPRDEIGRDLRRRNAEARLREREAGALRGDDDVGAAGEPHAAADRRAVDDRDGRAGWAFSRAKKWPPARFWSRNGSASPGAGGCASAADNDFRSAPGAEHAVRAGDGQRSEPSGAQSSERGVDLGDHFRGERVLPARIVERDRQMRAVWSRRSRRTGACAQNLATPKVLGRKACAHLALAARFQAEAEHRAAVARIDQAVVPEPRGGEEGGGLLVVAGDDLRRLRLHLLGIERQAPRAADSSATIAITLAACSPPITAMRAFGQENRKRGPNARPHMP